MEKFKRLITAMTMGIMLQIGSASAGNYLDTSFLKDEPYKKQKQKVDLSAIKTEHDMAVVKQAIDPVMRFIVGLIFADVPPSVAAELMTEHGRAVLKRPPLRNKFNRYASHRIGNWRVCGAGALSIHVVFTDLVERRFWSEQFYFVNDGSGWRFDDHREAKC